MRFITLLSISVRYLKDQKISKRNKYLRLVTLALGLVALGLFLFDYLWMENIYDEEGTMVPFFFRTPFQKVLFQAKVGFFAAFVFIGILVELIKRCTVFTMVSILGLLLGVGALITVLGAMNGLQSDLKEQILYGQPHIIIQHQNEIEPFEEYKDILKKLKDEPDVLVASPFIVKEMLLSTTQGSSPVFVKGIEPVGEGNIIPGQSRWSKNKLKELLYPKRALEMKERKWLEGKGEQDINTEELDDGLQPTHLTENKTQEENRKEDLVESSQKKMDPSMDPSTGPDWKKKKRVDGIFLDRSFPIDSLFVGDAIQLSALDADIGPMGSIPMTKTFYLLDYVGLSRSFVFGGRYAFIELTAMQRLLGWEDEVTGIEIQIRDPNQIEKVRMNIQRLLGIERYDVKDWKQRNVATFSALELEERAMFYVLWIIVMVATLSLVGNSFMLVWEKKKEIGMLKAMGATSVQIAQIFFFVGVGIGMIGIVIGTSLGTMACLFLRKYGIPVHDNLIRIEAIVSFKEMLFVVCFSFFLTCLATLYPSVIAARLSPLEALKK